MTLNEELKAIEADLKRLEDRKRQLYRLSVEAPENEKICEDHLAEMLGEPEIFKTLRYPIEINGITFSGTLHDARGRLKPGRLVRIRPCGKEFDAKTFLGLYLGDYARSVGCARNVKTGILEVYVGGHNPAIWIPSRGCIVYGFESWWGAIETEAQLKDLTNEAIDGIWYVQALKALTTAGPNASRPADVAES